MIIAPCAILRIVLQMNWKGAQWRLNLWWVEGGEGRPQKIAGIFLHGPGSFARREKINVGLEG